MSYFFNVRPRETRRKPRIRITTYGRICMTLPLNSDANQFEKMRYNWYRMRAEKWFIKHAVLDGEGLISDIYGNPCFYMTGMRK